METQLYETTWLTRTIVPNRKYLVFHLFICSNGEKVSTKPYLVVHIISREVLVMVELSLCLLYHIFTSWLLIFITVVQEAEYMRENPKYCKEILVQEI